MKILILGVNGFIGNALTRRILTTRGWEVYGMDLYSNKLEESLDHPRFHFLEGDIAINTIANLQSPMYRAYPQGQIFDVITNGKNTMMPYGDKLSPEERWAVVAYLRALQLSQFCPPEITPASIKATAK